MRGKQDVDAQKYRPEMYSDSQPTEKEKKPIVNIKLTYLHDGRLIIQHRDRFLIFNTHRQSQRSIYIRRALRNKASRSRTANWISHLNIVTFFALLKQKHVLTLWLIRFWRLLSSFGKIYSREDYESFQDHLRESSWGYSR